MAPRNVTRMQRRWVSVAVLAVIATGWAPAAGARR
jgi:hypothetical protein